jgi:hypothetical protein
MDFPKNSVQEHLFSHPIQLAGVVGVVGVLSFLIAKAGLAAAGFFIVLPLVAVFVYAVFMQPKIGLASTFILGFFVIGITRYVKGIPLGLGIDGLMVLTFLAMAFSKRSFQWGNLRNGLFVVGIIWMLINLLQLANPEAVSRVAWFYAMRGAALYMLLMIILGFVLLNEERDLDYFLYTWLGISILAAVWAMKQKLIGVDSFEQAWLNAGAATTHVLFGKLRAFGFYSDAGQFGAAMAHAFLSSTILALHSNVLRRKVFFGLVAVLCLYGQLLSGTRGALAVPVIGFFVYFFMSKNFKVLVLGFVAAFGAFYFLKFTTIAQNVYAIARLRTALDPNDASLQVRLENQRILSGYMASRPFGGGVGSSGNWGLRFSPNTFLANTPTDSWYVRVWAEYGVIGLSIYVALLIYIVIHSGIMIWNIKNDELRFKAIALYSGICGIFVASYGNSVLGQLPSALVVYLSMIFVYKAQVWDKDKAPSYENS